MTARYLNKKLQAAIKTCKRLRWEYGQYDQYYTGLKLVAFTVREASGRANESEVFCTSSLKGARGLASTLDEQGIRTTGYIEAVEEFERNEKVNALCFAPDA